MNKQDLVDSIAELANLTKKEADAALEAVVATIGDAMKKREKVTLVGFGTWEIVLRAARKGINPRTKEEISIPETFVVRFKPGKALRAAAAGESSTATTTSSTSAKQATSSSDSKKKKK